MNRVILHVDLNSFFATAEQQANPVLRGKPVGITKAVGRTCIIAASVEAKRWGVTTGSNVYDARKLCPQIILIPADFDKYADISMRFIEICKTYSPLCEVFSLDECFIDVTETEKFWHNVFNIAFEIKDRLRSEVGERMTVSCGVSHNRLLAKLASSQIKPDGLFWITRDNAISTLDKSDLTDVCGLGFALNRRLRDLGIDSFPKLRSKSLVFLHKHFGPFWSKHLYNIARGIDESPVVPTDEIPDAKSVGRTYTTHRDLTNKDEVLQLMRNLCEETTAKARMMGLAGRYVGLTLRGSSLETKSEYQKSFFEENGTQSETNSNVQNSKSKTVSNLGNLDFDIVSNFEIRASNLYRGELSFYGHRTLKNYIDDGKRLFDICLAICKEWSVFAAKPNVRFCGVTLGMLTEVRFLTTPLFSADRRRQDLVKTIDQINRRFGDYTVYPGQLLGMPIIRPEVNGYFGDKAYRLNFVPHG
ncbi:DNA polymerase IV [Candidatus Curtissbacteria bacterium]|nr:DNA polymerase IV [Candidatus Curtissbacteria bacterium]